VQPVTFKVRSYPVASYLVTPGGGGRHPAVVIVHGSGGDRSELLGVAKEFAQAGAVALTITAPSTTLAPPAPTTLAQLLQVTVETQSADVDAVRAAATYLSKRSDVDPKRLGYLGWSSGAKTGALVAASDPRFGALALLSAGAATVAQFAAQAPAADRAKVRRALTLVDPITAIAHARPGTVLLEDGDNDAIVPRPALLNVVHAAPRGTVVRWYPAGHALTKGAFHDAVRWVIRTLR
jgi:dienelactone hydrolase